MRQARQGRQRIARLFFCKRRLLGRKRSFLTMQSAPGAIEFHETGAEKGDSG